MDNKTDQNNSRREQSNDLWGQMNDKFNDFFTKSQPVPADHLKRNEEN